MNKFKDKIQRKTVNTMKEMMLAFQLIFMEEVKKLTNASIGTAMQQFFPNIKLQNFP